MSNFVFNISKGRVAELYNRVKTNDPANSAIVIMALATTGLEADSVLVDKDTFADVLSGSTNEPTNTGYVRKTLTDSDLAAFSPNDTSDRVDLDVNDITWVGVAAGTNWSKLVFGFDNDTTSGSDSNIIPLTCHDFSETPSGVDVVAIIDSAGFYRAQ